MKHALTSLRRRALFWVGAKLTVAAVAAAWLTACAAVRLDTSKLPSHAFDQPLSTPLGQSYWPRFDDRPGESGFHLLVSGPEAFAARAALAQAAQRSLDLQYYLVHHDPTSTLLLEAALRAAQRGVRVRLLVDDLNVGARESDLAVLDAHPNLEVRLFNPFAQRGTFGLARVLELLGNSDRLNRRMHNKLWIADGAVAVMGGRNLGDAYFNASPGSDFADLDVLAAGPVVRQMSESFDHYWNSAWAVPLTTLTKATPTAERESAWAELAARAQGFRDSAYMHALRETAFGGLVRLGQVPMQTAPAQILHDPLAEPGSVASAAHSTIFTQLHDVVTQAQHEVLLVSPYLVPGENGLGVLCGLVQRGVRVRILTNSLASTDVPMVHAGYARYRPRMLACGVTLHELRPRGAGVLPTRMGLSSGASLHSKAVVVDGKVVFIGSMNLDPRSRHLNSEVALRIDSPDLGSQLGTLFNEATTPDQAFHVELETAGNASAPLHWTSSENGQTVRYTDEPLASAWRRWVTRLLWRWAPEDLL